MKKLKIVDSVKQTANKVIFEAQKNSPKILAVTGTVGVAVGVVMFCKATMKVNDIMEEPRKTREKIKEASENKELQESGTYTEEDKRKDLTILYTQTGIKFAKLYAPAVIVTTFSVGCLLKSNKILNERNAALAAAYTAVDQGFKDYRGRVVERFGDEVDRQLKYNIKAEEVEETVIDEKGKEKVVKKTIDVVESDMHDQYSRIFCELNPYYEEDSELNMMFLKSRQIYANQQLIAKGRLFLNDVYEMLGFDRTREGQIIGWVYDPSNPNCNNCVDFGIFNIHSRSSKNFVNGYEPGIILDFNVDGNVWESM